MDIFIKKIVKFAGKIALDRYKQSNITHSKKGIADNVCEADILINNYLTTKIKERYPGHEIISEESEHKKGHEYTWVIDPIDGTRNFLNELPCFAIMVAIIFKGSVLMSVIYDPIHQELFFAKKNYGAFRNNIRIKCADKDSFSNSFGGITGSRLNNKKSKIFEKLITKSKKGIFFIYSNGSAGITSGLVASGKWDWMIVSNGALWDIAPATLLLSESGCKVTNLKGKEWKLSDKNFMASNLELSKKHLSKLLK